METEKRREENSRNGCMGEEREAMLRFWLIERPD